MPVRRTGEGMGDLDASGPRTLVMRAFRLANPALRGLRRAMRGTSLGVRVLVLREEAVFLVRHTYVPGWHLPGGGVDPGESAAAAAARELREEAGLVPEGPLHLHGLFFNEALGRRDHVALFVARAVRMVEAPGADWEIAQSGFFALDALPEGTSAPTLRRLSEVRNGAPLSVEW